MPKVPQTTIRHEARSSTHRSDPFKPFTEPKLYSSFLPIPLRLPTPVPIPSSSSKPLDHVTHHLYIRPDRPKDRKESSIDQDPDSTSDGRTMFAVNLPVDMTERDLRVLSGRWGVIETIGIGGGHSGANVLEDAVRGLPADSDDEDEAEEPKSGDDQVEPESSGVEPRFLGTGEPRLPRSKRPRRKTQLPPSVPEIIPLPPLDPRQTTYGPSGARSAYITFIDPISVSRAMSYSGEAITIPRYGEHPSNPTGLAYYTRLNSSLRPSLASVKEHADSAMARHDYLHSLLLSSRARKQGAGALVDEDGFTVVVRGGKYGRTGGSGALGVGVATKKDVDKAGAAGKKKTGVGAAELTDFYRFQKVDRKREGELIALTRDETR